MMHDLPSGAKLNVTPLSFLEAREVTQGFLREVAKIPDFRVDKELVATIAALGGAADQESDPRETAAKLAAILAFKSPLCALIGSPEVSTLVDKCFVKSTYNDAKITSDTFSDPKRWGDFIYCAFWALQENVSPFFANLASSLGTS
jgi:hypothetical protein